MGNCKVTKLKEAVDNNNLEILGTIRLNFIIPENPSTTNNAFSIKGGVRFELSDKTKNIYTNGSPVVSGYYLEYDDSHIGSKSFQLLDPGSYDLIIKPKYNLNGNFYVASTLDASKPLNLNMLAYTEVTSLTTRRSANFIFTGDLSSLKGHDMTVCCIDDSPSITGNFAEVCGPMINLTNFSFSNSKVTGDIIDFVRLQVKGGRTSYTFSSLSTLGSATYIKFNGQTIRNRLTNTLEWHDNAQDNTKTDITLQTGTVEQGDAPMTATVSKLL